MQERPVESQNANLAFESKKKNGPAPTGLDRVSCHMG